MRRMQLYELSQRFKIGFQHFQAAPLIAWASPVVAVDAADKNLAMVVDLRSGEPAGGTGLHYEPPPNVRPIR